MSLSCVVCHVISCFLLYSIRLCSLFLGHDMPSHSALQVSRRPLFSFEGCCELWMREWGIFNVIWDTFTNTLLSFQWKLHLPSIQLLSETIGILNGQANWIYSISGQRIVCYDFAISIFEINSERAEDEGCTCWHIIDLPSSQIWGKQYKQ